MPESISNSERITKNTIILYVRMAITMILSLYTSRVVLDALGVSDYGLYNVVGGVVTIFSFLMGAATVSTQRFLSYDIGQGNTDRLSKTFNLCLLTHILIAVFILLISETLGLWFVNNKLSIPEGREFAANLIFHFSVITLCIEVIVVPFSACVISHEKMNVYAFISIFDAIMKLVIALIVRKMGYDHLIAYGALLMFISVVNFIYYKVYCSIKYSETSFRFYFDRNKFKEIFSFSGYTMVGHLGTVAANQGTSLLINIFHGVVVNAAVGIGNQVDAAINGLASNFLTAFQPQITISYAKKDYQYLNRLIFSTSKLSFFLVLVIAIPVIFNIDLLLRLWLKTVPDYTNIFCIIFILSSAVNAMGNPLWIAVFATGKIKNLQIISTLLNIFDVIVVYFVFIAGMSPIAGIFVKLIINVVILFVRIIAPHKIVPDYVARSFITGVFIPMALIGILSFSPCLILLIVEKTTFSLILLSILSILISLLLMYFVGLNVDERAFFISQMKKKIHCI